MQTSEVAACGAQWLRCMDRKEDHCYFSIFFSFKNFFTYLFIFGCVGSSLLLHGLSLVVASGGYSLLRCAGFSLQWLLLLWTADSTDMSFNCCGMQAQKL